jgi:hypothetical protein
MFITVFELTDSVQPIGKFKQNTWYRKTASILTSQK